MNTYIKKFLQEKLTTPTIIEAGTASGYDTELLCEMFPKGIIYGFEPIPSLYELTKVKTNRFSNVHLVNKALSDKQQITSMFVADINNCVCESSSLLIPKDHLNRHPHVTFKQTINVETVALDEFVQTNKIDFIDLLWLDLQGLEPFVLKNNINSLQKTKYLFTEINLIEVYAGVMLWPEFESLLLQYGFETIWNDITPGVDAANAFLVNTKL
jgi:FkbM family methyltransferase